MPSGSSALSIFAAVAFLWSGFACAKVRPVQNLTGSDPQILAKASFAPNGTAQFRCADWNTDAWGSWGDAIIPNKNTEYPSNNVTVSAGLKTFQDPKAANTPAANNVPNGCQALWSTAGIREEHLAVTGVRFYICGPNKTVNFGDVTTAVQSVAANCPFPVTILRHNKGKDAYQGVAGTAWAVASTNGYAGYSNTTDPWILVMGDHWPSYLNYHGGTVYSPRYPSAYKNFVR